MYIVFLLILLKLVIGRVSLPPVPKLPATTTSCAPADPADSPRSVCWHYPTRTALERVVGYVPRASKAASEAMKEALRVMGQRAPHYLDGGTGVELVGFDTTGELEGFYREQPHRLYAGVVFPRLSPGGVDGRSAGVVQWNGTAWNDAAPGAEGAAALRADEPFTILLNGSYVPAVDDASDGEACRPLIAADGTTYGSRATGNDLPTFCPSMTYLSAGFLHVQSAVATALGRRVLRESAGPVGETVCPVGGGLDVDVTFEQAPLGPYTRSFGSITMRLFAAVYLTVSLSPLLAAAANAVTEDAASGQRASMEAAGLPAAAYWAGTASLSVASSLASAACLTAATVLLGLFSYESASALLLLTGAFAASLVTLGFAVATALRFQSRAVAAVVAAVQLVAPLVFVPLAYFGADASAFGACSLLSPVAFAAAMDVAVQAEAGAEPLTVSTMASLTAGRDVASGGAGGRHPLTAAGAFGMLVLDAWLYAVVAWYAESARRWNDAWFPFRREFWLGTPLLFHDLSRVRDDGDASTLRVEMEDPTRGGRIEVLLDDVAIETETDATPRSAASRRTRPIPTSVRLVDVYASDDSSDAPLSSLSSLSSDGGSGRGRRDARCLPSLFEGAKSPAHGKRRRNVVDGVTLSAYDGQVLALLGHSGSGKSAMLELMYGQRVRTGGEMEMFGQHVRIGKWSPATEGVSVGLCAQHAAIEGLLTPREHLAFYAQLHRQTVRAETACVENGFHSHHSAADRDALEALLADAGLADQADRDRRVLDLDQGRARALQVALAFAGAALSQQEVSPSSTTVDARAPRHLILLDEPTGDDTDPALQKTIWGLIRSRRKGATVVVATRSVAEASAVGDRIALISHGRVKCCGGPTFIRKLFGLGYRLHVSFGQGAAAEAGSTPADYSMDVLSAVRRHCPGVAFVRGKAGDHGDGGITLSLGDGKEGAGDSGGQRSAATTTLGPMLADLERSAETFNIADVALEATSLDEVFAHLGQEAEEESETLLPLDATGLDLDFDASAESLGAGLLSADEGDINADGVGGAAGRSGALEGNFRGGDTVYAWLRHTRALALARLSGFVRSPASTALLFLTPAAVALICLLIQSMEVRGSVEGTLYAWGHWVAPESSSRGIPVTFASPLATATEAAAVMSEALGDSASMVAASKAGELIGPSDGPLKRGGLHVTFRDVNLTACRVAATVVYDPIADVHVLPRAVSTLHTAAIRATAAAKGLPDAARRVNVTAAAAPLPYETPFGHAWSYVAAMIVPLIFVYIPATAAAHMVAERTGPHRLSLTLSGLSSSSYWSATFVSDVAMALIGAFAVATVCATVGVAPWDPAAAPASLAVIVSAIPSLLLCGYVASFVFSDAAGALGGVSLAMHVAGIITLFVLVVLPENDAGTRHFHVLMSAAVPSYALFSGAHLVCWRSLSDDNGAEAPEPGDYFLRGSLIRAGVEGAMLGAVLWAVALWVVERAYQRRLTEGSNEGAALAATASAARARSTNHAEVSEEVAEERVKIERAANAIAAGTATEDGVLLAACGLSAPPPPGRGDAASERRRRSNVGRRNAGLLPFESSVGGVELGAGGVADLWLGVRSGDVVALVGGTRSGKEAALRCAAGRDPFAGDVIVSTRGHARRHASVRREGAAALTRAGVGACLRDNALWGHLTALEHLALHATLRGERDPRRAACAAAEAVGLGAGRSQPADAAAGFFLGLGGRRRRDRSAAATESSESPLTVRAAALNASQQRQLALAIALIGHPPLLLLDCPTQRVDSVARRRVWSRIADHARRGGAVLLASDAVDEVEALCTRVAAVVDGELATIGTPQRLKARHGTAYTLNVQLRPSAFDAANGTAAASKEDVETLHALVASAAPCASAFTHDGAQGCSYELTSLDLTSLARLCASLEAAAVPGGGGGGAGGPLVEGYTLSQPTLQQVLLNLQVQRTAGRTGAAEVPATEATRPGAPPRG